MSDAQKKLDAFGLETFVPYLMNRIMGRYNAALHAEVSALGLTTPKLRTLAVLSVYDGILIRDLAVYAVVKQSTLSRALDGLERDGLIRRQASEEDGRAFLVFLTDAGRAAHTRLWPNMVTVSETLFKGIADPERAALIGTLQKMLRNIRKHDF